MHQVKKEKRIKCNKMLVEVYTGSMITHALVSTLAFFAFTKFNNVHVFSYPLFKTKPFTLRYLIVVLVCNS